MKLWQIDHDILSIIARCEEDGELSSCDAAALDALDLEKRDKVLNIVRLIKHLREEAAEASVVIAHAKGYMAQRDKKVEWLCCYLADHCEGEKYEDAYGSLSWRKSTAVEIDDLAAVPEAFQAYVPASYRPDKVLIGNALKEGKEVPGARLEERQNIQVK